MKKVFYAVFPPKILHKNTFFPHFRLKMGFPAFFPPHKTGGKMRFSLLFAPKTGRLRRFNSIFTPQMTRKRGFVPNFERKNSEKGEFWVVCATKQGGKVLAAVLPSKKRGNWGFRPKMRSVLRPKGGWVAPTPPVTY